MRAGFTLIRSVVLPAALPSFVGGLKQGWAFAWRSLLAGELIVLLGKESLGQQLQNTRQLADYSSMYAVMLMILIVGIVVDSCVFGTLDRWVRRRYGLIDAATRGARRSLPRSRSSTVTVFITSPTCVASATSMPSTTYPNRL